MCINQCKVRKIATEAWMEASVLIEKASEAITTANAKTLVSTVIWSINECMTAKELAKKFLERDLIVVANEMWGDFPHEDAQKEISVAEFIIGAVSCNCD